MSAGTSKLRWAQYEGVHQPALFIPAEEIAETQLPPGYSAVYLLGLDSTVVVPDADVTPYDPQDSAKTSHPAAALGVVTARQILEGFSADDQAAEAAQPTPEERRSTSDFLLDEDNDIGYHGERVAGSPLSGSDSDDEDGSAAEARRRRHEEKKRLKQEKKAAKKAAKKRERELATSVPTTRLHHHDDEDADDDGDDELLAALELESKYRPLSSENDAEHAKQHGPTSVSKTKKKEVGAEQQDGSWTALEANLFSSGDDDDDEGEVAGPFHRQGEQHRHLRSLQSGNRMGQALAALNASRAAPDIPGLSTSCPYAYPYLMEIDYEYQQMAKAATQDGLLLTKQEGEVVREIDAELRRQAAQRAFLQSVLEQRQRDVEDIDASTGSELEGLRSAIAKLEKPLHVADTLKRLIAKQVPATTAAFDRSAATRARRAVQRRTRTFQDASVMGLLEQLRAVDATPREDAAEVSRKYREQRNQHEALKSNFRGLSKTGFYAAPKPMEKWRRGRDMMLLMNAGGEAQRVRPTSYISQAYSTLQQRMKDHAEKRFDRVAVVARDGASFLDPHSFAGASHNGVDGSTTSAALSYAAQQQVVAHQLQNRLDASSAVLRREAFFQFHPLRCGGDEHVTLETVQLHPNFSTASTLAPAVRDSMDLGGIGSRAASAGRADDAFPQTEDGASLSYSAHSVAPSSYPYLFDHEPRARRPHGRHRSGSVSAGIASDTEGVSLSTSRATSMASAHSEHDEGDAEKNSRHHRGTRSSTRRGNGVGAATTATPAAAAGGGSTDWRSHAKRSILEQLTLYRRGRHGKPAVLNDDQCRDLCRLLLDRALRAEAEQQGVSLAVQSNNINSTFTKVTEKRLKKSVDNFLNRRMQQGTLFPLSSDAAAASRGVTGILGSGDWPQQHRRDTLPAMLNESGRQLHDASVEARQRAVADTPIFED